MSNPKTTILGYLALAGAVITAVTAILQGHTPDVASLLSALAGLGLIAAQDGGH